MANGGDDADWNTLVVNDEEYVEELDQHMNGLNVKENDGDDYVGSSATTGVAAKADTGTTVEEQVCGSTGGCSGGARQNDKRLGGRNRRSRKSAKRQHRDERRLQRHRVQRRSKLSQDGATTAPVIGAFGVGGEEIARSHQVDGLRDESARQAGGADRNGAGGGARLVYLSTTSNSGRCNYRSSYKVPPAARAVPQDDGCDSLLPNEALSPPNASGDFDTPSEAGRAPGLRLTVNVESLYAVARDAVSCGESPNVVFASVYRDVRNGSVAGMVLKNCRAVNHYRFAARGDPGAALTPDTALAEFVLNNALAEKELLLITIDDELSDAYESLFGMTEREVDPDEKCTLCDRPAEMRALIEDAAAGRRDNNNGNNNDANYHYYHYYACIYHATRNAEYRHLWRVHSPLVLNMSCESRDGGTTMVLRTRFKRFGVGGGGGTAKATTSPFTVTLSRRSEDGGAGGYAVDNSGAAAPRRVSDLHDSICRCRHVCTNDAVPVGDAHSYHHHHHRHHIYAAGSKLEKASCLLSRVKLDLYSP